MADQVHEVALSFAGEDRGLVREVAEILRAAGVGVFFDEFQTVGLWGKDLAVEFAEIYERHARFVVAFVSASYVAKAWPQHEFRNALAGAINSGSERVLPVRLDDTELPGLRSTIAYLDARKIGAEGVASAILEKLGRPAGRAGPDVSADPRMPRVMPSKFNPYAETEKAYESLKTGLTERARRLESRGLVSHVSERDGRFALRVIHGGRTVYSLDMWIGDAMGGNELCFYDGTGGSTSRGSMTGIGPIEWDRERGGPLIKLTNFSLLNRQDLEPGLTVGELLEGIWDKLCSVVESAAE
jgi:hypothetical protein